MTNVSDTFNRADTTGPLGTSSSGTAWTAAAGTLGISGNQAYCVTTANNVSVVETSVAYGELNVTIAATASGARAGLHFRGDGTVNNTWYFRKHVDNTAILAKVVGGTTTNFTSLKTVSAGDVLTVVFKGDVIRCYVNDVATHTVTDSANNTNTKHGIHIIENTGKLDDFNYQANPLYFKSAVTATSAVSKKRASSVGRTVSVSPGISKKRGISTSRILTATTSATRTQMKVYQVVRSIAVTGSIKTVKAFRVTKRVTISPFARIGRGGIPYHGTAVVTSAASVVKRVGAYRHALVEAGAPVGWHSAVVFKIITASVQATAVPKVKKLLTVSKSVGVSTSTFRSRLISVRRKITALVSLRKPASQNAVKSIAVMTNVTADRYMQNPARTTIIDPEYRVYMVQPDDLA